MGEVLVLEKRVSYSPGTDYDALWKKIISELFEEFILSQITKVQRFDS